MLPFSEDTINKARNINLVDYLISVGEPIVKEGKNYRLKKHDSLTINAENSLWKWNSHDVGGKNAIDYLMTVENKTFSDAVTALVGNNTITAVHNPPSKKAEFILPKPAENNRRAFAYLHKERKILPEVINHFIKEGFLYEDGEHHNAVFVGNDEKGTPRFACKRSTVTLFNNKETSETPAVKKHNTRWEVEGSKKEYGFRELGRSDRMFVFEAPIDMLSFISLRVMTQKKEEWKKDSYLSLSGVSDRALKWVLSQKKGGERIKRIVFCLDNDTAGQENSKKLCKEFKERYSVSIKPPKSGKDYNDYLKIAVNKGVNKNG